MSYRSEPGKRLGLLRRRRDHTDSSEPFDDCPTVPLRVPPLTDPVAIAEVLGPLAIPQLTVGTPSHAGEPVPPRDVFRAVPFRPASVIDGWSTETVTVRGASLRGHLHCYNGAPRQDDFAVHRLAGDRIAVVVADGVSAATQSHIGAGIATRYAAEWLRSHLAEDLAATDWLGLYKTVAWALATSAQSLFGLTEPDPLHAERELATTLVCAVIEPSTPGRLRAYLTCVGDSGAWLMSPGGFTPILGSKTTPGSGIASAAVTGLPRVPAEMAAMEVEVAAGEVLLVGTDGVGDPLGEGNGGVGSLLRAVLGGTAPPSLIEFAHALDFSREMFDDDRTLVAIWPRAAASATRSGETAPDGMNLR